MARQLITAWEGSAKRASVKIAACIALATGAAGCSDTQFEEATGDGLIRAVNASVDAPSAVFLIEEVALNTSLDYKSISAPEIYDDLTYTFNFEVPVPGEFARRIASQTLSVVNDTDYTFVLAGTVNSPDVFLWERAERIWDGSETVFDLAFGHTNRTIGEIDVYFAAPGTPPALGSAAATLAYGEFVAPVDFAEGDYEIIATAKDDPTAVLYQSNSLSIDSSISYVVTFFDADPSITGPISVRLLNSNGAALEIPDRNFPPTLQVVHAALGSGNVDLARDGDFANLLFSDLSFGSVSTDVDVATTTSTYTYAQASNTTALFEDTDRAFAAGSRTIMILAGEPGSLVVLPLLSVRRGIATAAQLRIVNTSTSNDNVDVYLLGDDQTTDDVLPFRLQFGVTTALTQQAAGTYNIVVTPAEATTPELHVGTLTLANSDLVEVVIIDNVDPSIVDLLTIDNLP